MADQFTSSPLPGQEEPAPLRLRSSKSGKRMLWFGLAALIILAAVGAAAYYFFTQISTKKIETTSQTAKETIKIGVFLTFSGPSSSMGYGSLKGIELAKKQLRVDNIEIIQADGKCEPDVAPKALQELLNKGVVAVIGESCSSASVAALPVANQNKVVTLSPSASNPKLSIADDYFYRTAPSDIGQGTFLAQSMFDRGIRKTAVFYTNEPYGSAINDVFKQSSNRWAARLSSLPMPKATSSKYKRRCKLSKLLNLKLLPW